MNFLKPYLKYLLISWILVMIVASSIPNIPTLRIHTARSNIRLDYLLHFCEYGLLAFLTFLSFTSENFKISFPKLLMITTCLSVFAFLDELHQKLIPGRTYSIKDIISDISGIITVIVITSVLFRSLKNKQKTV